MNYFKNIISYNNNQIKIKDDHKILDKHHSDIILTMSFLFGLNSLYGLYNYIYHNMQFINVLLTNTLLFLSSVNYWRNPVYGFRRNLDMCISGLNFFYNAWSVSHCHYSWICFCSMKIIVIGYGISWFYHNKNRRDLGVFWHCIVHLAGNIGNGVILGGIVSVPLLYDANSSITTSNLKIFKNIIYSNVGYIISLTTFILYTTSYTLVIKSPYIANLITPTKYKILSKNHTHDLVSYIVSTVHSIILCIVGLFICIGKPLNQSSVVDLLFYFSSGYYVSDILYLLTTSPTIKSAIPTIIHHLSVIFCQTSHILLPISDFKSYATYCAARMALAEYSVLPLNYIWYLKNTDKNYKINIRYVTAFEALFRLFFVFRIINYSHLIYEILLDGHVFNPMAFMLYILTTLNYVWFYKIYKIKTSTMKYYVENSKKTQ